MPEESLGPITCASMASGNPLPTSPPSCAPASIPPSTGRGRKRNPGSANLPIGSRNNPASGGKLRMPIRRLALPGRSQDAAPLGMMNKAPTCSTSARNPGSHSTSPWKTVPSSSSIPTEPADQHPRKTDCRKMLGNAERMFMFKNNDRAHESLLDKNSASKILRLALHRQPYSSFFLQISSCLHPSLPDADSRAGRPR